MATLRPSSAFKQAEYGHLLPKGLESQNDSNMLGSGSSPLLFLPRKDSFSTFGRIALVVEGSSKTTKHIKRSCEECLVPTIFANSKAIVQQI
jgi:hypothetical protein